MLEDDIIQKAQEAHSLYYRLVLVIGQHSSGKTSVLRKVNERINAPLINVSLEMSRQLIGLTDMQRKLRAAEILSELVSQFSDELVLLDNIELLFDCSLSLDPLKLLQNLSHNKIIVATWPGRLESSYLCYASPGHPEYRSYRINDIILIDINCPRD